MTNYVESVMKVKKRTEQEQEDMSRSVPRASMPSWVDNKEPAGSEEVQKCYLGRLEHEVGRVDFSRWESHTPKSKSSDMKRGVQEALSSYLTSPKKSLVKLVPCKLATTTDVLNMLYLEIWRILTFLLW